MELSIFEQIIRIFVAIVVGSVIGFERRKQHKSAGIRTHAIITVICTMLTIVSVYGFRNIKAINIDPTRLLSNILTGVGFLAGGVIYVTTKKDSNKATEEEVVGLTTAAGIFGAAMLGIPIGLGYYPLVVITVVAFQITLKLNYVLEKLKLIEKNSNDDSNDD